MLSIFFQGVKPMTCAEMCEKELLDTEQTFLNILTMIREVSLSNFELTFFSFSFAKVV